MQAFLLLMLFFPLFLHSYVLFKRKSPSERALIGSHALTAKDEIPPDSSTRLSTVDDSMFKQALRPSAASYSHHFANACHEVNDLAQQVTKPTISLQSETGTTNVLLEPRSTNTAAIAGGVAGGAAAAGAGGGIAACCADTG
jgi:hypothetical protein